jgi:hypothetical protein
MGRVVQKISFRKGTRIPDARFPSRFPKPVNECRGAQGGCGFASPPTRLATRHAPVTLARL